MVSCTSCSRASRTASSRPIIFDDQLEPGELGGEVLADEAAVAQHGDAIGDAVHLIEEVGDEHHRHAGRPHPLDHLEQLVDLAGVEAGRGLVEDQHPGVDLHRPGDRHELLHGDRVRLERRRRVDVEVQLLEHLGWCAGASPASRCGRSDADSRPSIVFSATERLAARLTSWYTVLMPAVCAWRRAVHLERLAHEEHLAAVDAMDAGERLDSVDLPAPFSPSRAWTSPGNRRSDTPSRASTPGNETVMSRICTVGWIASRRWLGVRHARSSSLKVSRIFAAERSLGRVPAGTRPRRGGWDQY